MGCFGFPSPPQLLGPPQVNLPAPPQATQQEDDSSCPLAGPARAQITPAGFRACDSVQDQSQVQLMAHNLIREIISGSRVKVRYIHSIPLVRLI